MELIRCESTMSDIMMYRICAMMQPALGFYEALTFSVSFNKTKWLKDKSILYQWSENGFVKSKLVVRRMSNRKTL